METTQHETLHRPRTGRRTRLAWGLMIAAGILLSANLYDSIQYYLGHRMTVGHLLWSFADAHEWYGVTGYLGETFALFTLLALFLVISAFVADAMHDSAKKLEIGALACLLLWMAGLAIPLFKSGTFPSISTCIDTQRQLALAAQMFAQDHDRRLPNDWSTLDVYLGEMRYRGHYVCPQTLEPFHRPGGYGLNGQIAGMKERNVTDPQQIFIIADSIKPEMILHSRSDIATRRHPVDGGRGFAVSYVDGHAKFVPENVTLKWK
ncbi:MAG: hypothetical protein ACYC6A_08420 [Armatimonadota bacterium]